MEQAGLFQANFQTTDLLLYTLPFLRQENKFLYAYLSDLYLLCKP